MEEIKNTENQIIEGNENKTNGDVCEALDNTVASQGAATPATPATHRKQAQRKPAMSFGKVFIAALAAVVVGGFVTFLAIIILFSGISSMFAPEVKGVPENAILKLDLSENILDAPSKNPLSGFNFNTMQSVSQITLYDALKAIDAAKNDERIKGIYINITGSGSTTGNILEEIRTALVDFKASGKKIYAYNEVYSHWMYYISSVADKIYIQPEGTFEWVGMGANTIFFKGLFDKLGVSVDILRPTACKFKSAVEPYFRTEMSEENRLQMQQMVDGIWNEILTVVADSRGITKEQLNALADELAVILPNEAVEHKFVDGVMYADQMEELLKSEFGVETLDYVSLGEYSSALVPDVKNITAPKVAILYANGNVMDGNGTDDNIYGYTLSRDIRALADDDDVKAVVMRVNSPGGSALASDLIWREVELLKQKKPVIVSMGSYAASGGYYISAPADAIVASRLTLTGSIGVFGMVPSYGAALKDKVGVTFDGVATNKHALMGDGTKPFTEQEYNAMMRSVDRVYERFTSLVAQGRNLTIEKVLEIAEGRVWSGLQAQQIGLVDTCGGLNAALAIAVDKAELGENFQIVEHTTPATGFMAMVQGMGVKMRQAITSRTELGELYLHYKQVEDMLLKEGVYTLCPQIINFE